MLPIVPALQPEPILIAAYASMEILRLDTILQQRAVHIKARIFSLKYYYYIINLATDTQQNSQYKIFINSFISFDDYID